MRHDAAGFLIYVCRLVAISSAVLNGPKRDRFNVEVLLPAVVEPLEAEHGQDHNTFNYVIAVIRWECPETASRTSAPCDC